MKLVILNKKSIFLLDAIGAMVSAVLLAIVLPYYQRFIGLPVELLYFLSGVAALLMCYSFFCFQFLNVENSNWLKVIMIANLAYCFLTASLIFDNFESMTFIGITYFSLEIGTIVGLVFLERSVCKKSMAEFL